MLVYTGRVGKNEKQLEHMGGNINKQKIMQIFNRKENLERT